MKPFIQITRHQDDVEPSALRLVIIASNGLAAGCLDFYIKTSDLKETGNALTEFSYKKSSKHMLEVGSDLPEEKFAHYFHFKAFPTGKSFRSYAIQIRLNNNEKSRDNGWPHLHQESDFCIETDIDDLRNLGQLLIDFSKLDHNRLYWTSEVSYIDTVFGQTPQNYGDAKAEVFAVLPK